MTGKRLAGQGEKPRFRISTDRMVLILPDASCVPGILRFVTENRDFHKPFDPRRDELHFTETGQRTLMEQESRLYAEGRSLPLYLYRKEALPPRHPPIGRICFSQITGGSFRSCMLGYKLARTAVGQGYATEAIREAIRFLFAEYGLHRIEANILPDNEPSIRLVNRLGFREEGFFRRYLEIDGTFRDHRHFVLLNDNGDGDVPREPDPIRIPGQSILLRSADPTQLASFLRFLERNRDFLAEWHPGFADIANSPGFPSGFLWNAREAARTCRGLVFLLYLPDRPDTVVGWIALEEVRPEPWASGEISFAIDRDSQGRGLMAEALELAIGAFFRILPLRRLTACCLSRNERSARLLRHLSFREEGLALRSVRTARGDEDVTWFARLREIRD